MFFKGKAGQIPACVYYCSVDNDSRDNVEWYAAPTPLSIVPSCI